MTNLTPRDLAKRVVDKSEYTITWAGFTDEPNTIRRTIITSKLADKLLAISIHKVSLKNFARLGVVNNDGKMDFQYRGIGFAKANYVNGVLPKIKMGDKLALDYITGDSVCGINDSWGKNEYRTLGIALESFEKEGPYNEGENLIMVWLKPVENASSAGRLLYTSGFRGPGRVTREGKQIPGYWSAYRVNIIDDTITEGGVPVQVKVLSIDESQIVPVIHPGRRDVRPNSFVFAMEEENSGLNVITTEYLE